MKTLPDGIADTVKDKTIVDAYLRGYRIKVYNRFTGETRTGFVGRTMGVKPAFLLLHRRDQTSSMHTLGPDDRVIAVKYDDTRHYIPLTRYEQSRNVS